MFSKTMLQKSINKSNKKFKLIRKYVGKNRTRKKTLGYRLIKKCLSIRNRNIEISKTYNEGVIYINCYIRQFKSEYLQYNSKMYNIKRLVPILLIK